MSKRKSLKRVKVTITLPKYLLDAIDELAEMTESNRSYVIEAFTDYGLNDQGIVDELFPYEETEEEEIEEEEFEEEA